MTRSAYQDEWLGELTEFLDRGVALDHAAGKWVEVGSRDPALIHSIESV